jgi:hypothetical protein
VFIDAAMLNVGQERCTSLYIVILFLSLSYLRVFLSWLLNDGDLLGDRLERFAEASAFWLQPMSSMRA